MNKLNYEFIKQKFKDGGCTLLESLYKTAHTPMKYICNCGKIDFISYNNFKYDKRCKECGIKKTKESRKLTFEEVNRRFKEKGFELLETIYHNAKKPLKFKCSCGNISKINLMNLSKTQKCMKCNGTEKFTYEYVKEYIESFNYKLLSDEYINNRKKLNMICDKNHECLITLDKFRMGGRCFECSIEKRRGENASNWNPDRTRKVRLEYLCFDKRKKHILYDDPNYNNYLNNPENYHIDHIFPRIAFIDYNIDKKFGLNICKELCNSIENLRIITREENLKKSCKYNHLDFLLYIQRYEIQQKIN